MPRVLFVVSATLGPQRGPRKDYAALASALGADVIDYASIERSKPARLLAKFGGRALAQAFLAFSRRNDYDVILTDGEHIGIPLAAVAEASARARRTRDDRAPHHGQQEAAVLPLAARAEPHRAASRSTRAASTSSPSSELGLQPTSWRSCRTRLTPSSGSPRPYLKSA